MTPWEIRQLREFFRLTPAEFAERCGVDEDTVVRWEMDPRSPQALQPSEVQSATLEALTRQAEICHTPAPHR